MMAGVADEPADVVEQGGVLEPFAFAVSQPVHGPGLVEERQRQPDDLLRVLGVVVAPFTEFERAAPPDVGDLVDLSDLPAVAADVVEHQAFAQGQVAERELFRAEPAQDGVEEDGAGDHQIGAPRIEAGHGQALLGAQRDDLFAELANLLGRHAQVAELGRRRSARGRGGDGAKAEDRAGRANHPIEADRGDLIAVSPDLATGCASRACARRGQREDHFGRTARSVGSRRS